MKILLWDECIDNMGGVERILSTIANNLSKTNEVIVISKYKTHNESFYKYYESIKIHYLVDLTNNLSKNYKNKKIIFYFFRIFEKICEILCNKIKTLYYMCKYCKIDTIIFGRVFMAVEYLPFIIRKKHKKIIVRDAIHLYFFDEKMKFKMKKLFPKYVTHFIVSSDESIKEYKNFFKTSKMQLLKLYNPLSIEPIAKYSYNNKTVISMGRFDNQKGFENLVLAFEIVHQRFPDWRLKIFGAIDNEYKKELDNIIKNINGYNYIQLLPASKDVVSIFNESSIFVSTSRYEGYANILVEAMSCGIPCISYNWLMGVDEIIDDKKNGIIVPLKDRKEYFFSNAINKEDIETLAQQIIYLIQNPSICDKFSNSSLQIANERLEDKIMLKWLNIIKSDVNNNEK